MRQAQLGLGDHDLDPRAIEARDQIEIDPPVAPTLESNTTKLALDRSEPLEQGPGLERAGQRDGGVEIGAGPRSDRSRLPDRRASFDAGRGRSIERDDGSLDQREAIVEVAAEGDEVA